MKALLAVAAIPILMLSNPGPCGGDDDWDENWEAEQRWMEENNIDPVPTVVIYESCEEAEAAGRRRAKGGFEAWLIPSETDYDGDMIVCDDTPTPTPAPTGRR